MPEVRQDAVLQDPEEVLQAVVEHERDLAEEAAVPFQGEAAVAATAMLHDHKVQKPATEPDVPAEVTDVRVLRLVVEAAAAFHANKNAAEAARQSRVHAEEAEHTGSQAAVGGAVTVDAAVAAQEESRFAAAAAA